MKFNDQLNNYRVPIAPWRFLVTLPSKQLLTYCVV